MIGFADGILGRGGRLNAALGEHYQWQAPRRPEAFAIAKRPRVGVDYAGAWARRLLRFYIRDNQWVSRP